MTKAQERYIVQAKMVAYLHKMTVMVFVGHRKLLLDLVKLGNFLKAILQYY